MDTEDQNDMNSEEMERYTPQNPGSPAQAFVDEMGKITSDPTFTTPTSHGSDAQDAGKGNVSFGNMPASSKAQKL